MEGDRVKREQEQRERQTHSIPLGIRRTNIV